MTNMSPFEIRLELLKMAKDLLLEEYSSNKDRLQQDWNVKVDAAKLNGQPIPEHPPYPAYPSEADVIAKASALNGFVSQIPITQEKTNKKST